MAVAPVVAQLAVPAAIQLFGTLVKGVKASQQQAEVQPPAPPEPWLWQPQAALAGKGAKINLYV